MAATRRHSTGVPGLDRLLGGGLLPGTLTAVVGATGIGKTQFGIQYARAGMTGEGQPGVIFDMSARGDAQSHQQYAQRLFDWSLSAAAPQGRFEETGFFLPQRRHGDYLHVFDYHGRRVTRRDLEWDDWRRWQAEFNHRLQGSIAFLYGNFVQGRRRVVIDGIEPVDRPQESIQLNLFEYIYHQILRKDPLWVARDLFREAFRRNATDAEAHTYDPAAISCLLLCTSAESMLDDLICRRLDEGDSLSNANTLIYMGKLREGNRILRGMYVAKHRGSECTDEIVPYRIDQCGLNCASEDG